MHLALRHVEVDAVEGDDLAEGLADRACANREPFGRWSQTRQCVSGLGMNAPGTFPGR
jgi:hypothetical protein